MKSQMFDSGMHKEYKIPFCFSLDDKGNDRKGYFRIHLKIVPSAGSTLRKRYLASLLHEKAETFF